MPATLGEPSFADFKFRLTQPDAPANARFRVAVDERGAIRFCFLIESSGDPALDEQARNFLQLCRFKVHENSAKIGGAALVWTSATILWGNDLAPVLALLPIPARDPRQSGSAGYDLSAGFSCGGFSCLVK